MGGCGNGVVGEQRGGGRGQRLGCPVEATPEADPTIWVHRSIFLHEHKQEVEQGGSYFHFFRYKLLANGQRGQQKKDATPSSAPMSLSQRLGEMLFEGGALEIPHIFLAPFCLWALRWRSHAWTLQRALSLSFYSKKEVDPSREPKEFRGCFLISKT